MSIMLALGAAAFYGSSDFMGAVAARRSAVLAVALLAQIAGLALLIPALFVLPAPAFGSRVLLFGAAAGVFGGIGLVAVYKALARGPMSVAAPTTALAASAVPIVAGLVTGERPGPSSLVGMAVAFGAVTLITRDRDGAQRPAGTSALGSILPALVAGAVLGLFFVLLHGAGEGAGLWPLFAARLVSIPVLAILLVSHGVRIPRERALVGSVVASGVLDMGANVMFLVASQLGMLAVVAAITGLYPAVTIVLAQVRLGERMQPIQFAGLGVALVAAALVAV